MKASPDLIEAAKSYHLLQHHMREKRALLISNGQISPPTHRELNELERTVLVSLLVHTQETASVLAKKLGLDEGYLSRSIKKLETAGWLKRTRSDLDRRSFQLELTPKGKKRAEKIYQEQIDDFAATFSCSDESQWSTLAAKLQALLQALEATKL